MNWRIKQCKCHPQEIIRNDINDRNQLFAQVENNQVFENKFKKFNYQLLKDYPNIYGSSFAFNQDATQLFVGQVSDIKVYEFNKGEILNELQTLCAHKDSIFCLIYLNKSSLLVSGSWDKLIVIWSQEQDGSWRSYKILDEHQDYVNFLINNYNENLLISGSRDKTIKFWNRAKTTWDCKQTLKTKFEVLSLSLNKQQTKLISCGDGAPEILIIEYKPQQQQWIIIQTIHVNCSGKQLCFISDNQFAFQSSQNFLEIYQLKEKQFLLEQQITVMKVQWEYITSYQSQYVDQNEVLFIKNGNYLNCFGKDLKQNYILQQSIEFYDDYFFGIVSNDGEYLVTYDGDSESVKIRKFCFQNDQE